MSKDFHESYVDEHPDMPSERGTGFVFAGVAAIISLFIFYYNDYTITNGFYFALGFSALFAGLAQFAPDILRPLNILWFKFSMLLFKIMNPVIMFLLFVVVIVPAGLIMQLKRDPLRRKVDKSAKTYWIEKEPEASTRSMKNQF